MLSKDVAPGIHMLTYASTNLYLVEYDDRVLIVDSGLPRVWPHLISALEELGRKPDSVDGIVLTHAHFDHVGTARRAQKEWNVPVWVHTDDERLARHPYRYQHKKTRLLYPTPITTDQALPGAPVVIPTPGHTVGHIALHFPDRDALIAGDALVTLDPYTAQTGPQIVAGAATADSGRALGSVKRLADTHASVVLPGHGKPWNDGIEAAADLALSRGPY